MPGFVDDASPTTKKARNSLRFKKSVTGRPTLKAFASHSVDLKTSSSSFFLPSYNSRSEMEALHEVQEHPSQWSRRSKRQLATSKEDAERSNRYVQASRPMICNPGLITCKRLTSLTMIGCSVCGCTAAC